MEPTECPVTWPTDVTAGDLMPDYVRPQHRCSLTSDHVQQARVPLNPDAWAGAPVERVPHRCHCGSWQPVRDVETARS